MKAVVLQDDKKENDEMRIEIINYSYALFAFKVGNDERKMVIPLYQLADAFRMVMDEKKYKSFFGEKKPANTASTRQGRA